MKQLKSRLDTMLHSKKKTRRGRLSEKSNIHQRESKIRFWPCIGVRSVSVSRGLFGQCFILNDLSGKYSLSTDKLHFASQLFSGISYSYLQHNINWLQKTEQPA